MTMASGDPQSFRRTSDSSPQPIIAVEGPSHIVRYVNSAFCSLVGTESERLLGSPFAQAVPESATNRSVEMLDRVFATGIAEGLSEQAHGEDANTHICWSYLAWVVPGPVAGEPAPTPGIVVHITDSTEIAAFRQRAAAMNERLLLSSVRQHELIAEAEALNLELRQREQREREARESAEAADRSKDVFLRTLSHELRSPLNAVLGWAVMLRANGRSSDDDLAEGLAVIERNARAQSKLIEDVLDVARITSGKFMLEAGPVEMTTLVRAAIDTVRPAADAKAISFGAAAGTDSVWLHGDAPRLQQTILNLLANAIKFTPRGGRVTIRLEGCRALADGDAPTARITVIDNGKGIDPAFLPHVFDRFRQAGEGTTRAFGGLGLGLSIVQYVVKAHGGTVTAESEGEGCGATFTIELPAMRQSDAPIVELPVAAGEALPRIDGLRVLAIDDEQDARTVVQRALQEVGASVVLATSADEGYRLALGGTPLPHVIVSDIGMPHEDGYALMRRIRATKASHGLPALAVTAFAAPEDKRRALAAGYQSYMSKPIDLRELVSHVAALAARTDVTASSGSREHER